MKRIILLFFSFLFFSLPLYLLFSSADDSRQVYVIPIHKVIDLGLSGFVERVCLEAKDKADIVIFDINTFGGRVDAAGDICDAIFSLGDIPTYAFVRGEAWSAGALISLACKNIIMTPGSSIGSAEPRQGAMGGKETTDEKIVSALRAKFKATAEKNGHSKILAWAMVDKDVEVRIVQEMKDNIEILTKEQWENKPENYKKRYKSEILVKEGKLLNLTAEEAKNYSLAKGIINTKRELIDYAGFKDAEIKEFSPNWSEVLVRILTHPIISSLLMTIGFLGIFFELRMPGWGVSGTIGVISLILFFLGHYFIGLANWGEVALCVLGVILLGVELFITPGFGILGGTGIICILSSLFLALIKNPLEAPQVEITGAFSVIGYSLAISLILIFVIMRWVPKSRIWKKITLTQRENKEEGYSQVHGWEKYIGRRIYTRTPLRPTGKIEIDGEVMDVVTEGDFLDKDVEVEITEVSGNKIVVRKV